MRIYVTLSFVALIAGCGASESNPPAQAEADAGPLQQADESYDGRQSGEAVSPPGESTPQWGHNGHSSSQNGLSPYAGPSTPGLLWDVALEDAVGGANVVIDAAGMAYMRGGSMLYAVSPTGQLSWSRELSDIGGYLALGRDGTLYAGGAALHAIDSTDGSLKWKIDTPGSVETTIVVADDGSIQFGSYREDEAAHYHVANRDGSLRWSKKLNNSGAVGSSALAPDGTIYVPGDKLRALAPSDGRTLWEADVRGLSPLFGPAVGPDGTVFLASNEGGPGRDESRLYAITQAGEQAWSVSMGFLELTPAVGPDGTVYVHNYGGGGSGALERGVYALNPDGSVRWRFDISCPSWSFNQNNGSDSSPTVDSAGTVYFGSECGTVFAVDKNGDEKWRFGIDGEFDNRPAISRAGTLHICHAGGGPQDWWRGFYRCYALGNDGRPMPEPESTSRFGYCEQRCGEDDPASVDSCQYTCLVQADRYCTNDCAEVIEGEEGGESSFRDCLVRCHERFDTPTRPGSDNQVCTSGVEVGRTCTEEPRCSSGEYVAGCCIGGVCR
jgi:hypothetical protein